MAARYLVAYDVKDNRRRNRTAKVVYAYALGGQRSALETVLTPSEADILMQEIGEEIDKEEDQVNLIKVKPGAILLGRAKQLDFDDGAILV